MNTSNLSTKDLMIGDWVQNPLGWKARVMSIKHTCVIKDEWEYLFKIGISKDTFQNYLSESDLSPIPLTPEILEKNEFLCEQDRWWWKDFCIALASTKALTLVCNRTIQIKYIHQLQHALRLCGIEKEIIL